MVVAFFLFPACTLVYPPAIKKYQSNPNVDNTDNLNSKSIRRNQYQFVSKLKGVKMRVLYLLSLTLVAGKIPKFR